MGVMQVLSGLISRLLLALSLAAPICATAEIQVGEPQELRDLHYGEALFQLYQQKYFPAIIHLLSARKQGLMAAYEDEPELLLGGLYLAYGMPNTAESLFNRVLKQSASPNIQSRAWLQLGKSRHRRGSAKASLDALKHMGDDLDSEISDEKYYLSGLINLIQNNETQALSDLSKISEQTEWSLYGRFNLAMSQLQSNQQEKGLALLQEIGSGSKETDDAEAKSIRDRANLARGFLLLETQQAEEAKKSLQRVRLKSPSSSQALLGLGWASLQLGNQEQALAPWQLLADRNTSDPAVLEAKLAIPYVLSLLQADRQSLEAYRDAIDTYDSSILQLDQMLQTVTKGDFPNILLDDSDLASTTETSKSELNSLLSYLLSGNVFQARLQDYHDLLFIEKNLQQWQKKISSYRTMLANQLDAYKQNEPRVDAHLKGKSLNKVMAEKDRLKALYKKAETTEEPLFALANQQEKGWIERLKRINRLIDKHKATGQLSTQSEMARLMEGILTWRMTTEHPARIWALKKQMNELEQKIEQTQQSEKKLAEARTRAEDRFGSFTKRIEQLEADIPQLQRQLTKLRQSEAGRLQEIALSKLEKRRSLINNYLIQARFGVANLMDLSAAREGAVE